MSELLPPKQELFDLLHDMTGKVFLQSEMDDIIRVVNKISTPAAPKCQEMTENELRKMISEVWNKTMLDQIKAGQEINATDVIKAIIRSLRDAGVLLVREGK